MTRAPVLFISHGAPTFALEPGKLGARLQAMGKGLSGVEAVLVVSPHWQTECVKVMADKAPATRHDFGGFPQPLYDLQYPARGHPQFAAEATRLLADAGFEASLDDRARPGSRRLGAAAAPAAGRRHSRVPGVDAAHS
jgi:4,5-DOPA dioxygenase extradiol